MRKPPPEVVIDEGTNQARVESEDVQKGENQDVQKEENMDKSPIIQK